MIFEIDNVELYFKNKRILNGIYLKAETGKVTSLLGSNGSGKSCLLNIAFGTLNAKYSHIRLDSKPVLKPLYLTKTAAFLPQYNFTPNQAKVNALFLLFDISWTTFIADYPEFKIHKNNTINKLSGGERRVIEIYLILKKNAEIILLDEPFNGVAPLYIKKIQTLIIEEKQHKAIILTDHRYAKVIAVSDTIYLIKNGCSKLIDNITELEDYSYLSNGSL
ncbi:ABC transporter ATP-binding protein [Olleya sp. HaHaR_3_96]|uniref:ATP-binding cassette domain-containing protein n=1 Tax=Olleya sp. HaHaR_3_96 TaxID=2745560 RepID=UPI001C4FACCA|nr:ABC transporter ATP-binding protein [Olleya sp. HaHaR_3_96]QXP59759.1 ABC transporter ATP-binding protein [Olleya sp. HaHaR_3_96]